MIKIIKQCLDGKFSLSFVQILFVIFNLSITQFHSMSYTLESYCHPCPIRRQLLGQRSA